MAKGKSFVEQEWKPSQELVNASNIRRILHRVTKNPDPETRQSLMIPVRSSAGSCNTPNLSSNYPFGLFSSMTREDEPGKTKMSSMAELFAGKIRIVEEQEKLGIIHTESQGR